MTSLPRVSVILPVLNAERDLRVALTTLFAQDYPRELLEVIVVDNGSTDRTKDVAREFPVILLEEPRSRNAYMARNAGLRIATGEIIALTDADCTIDRLWLRAAVRRITEEGADMVGGNIIFTFPEGTTAGAIVDSLVNLRNDLRAPKRGRAVTANLVVRATLFSTVGLFPDGDPMAGDIIWTANASAQGFRMVYGEDAVVHHPARGLRPLLRKTFVLGRAYAYQQRGLLKPDLNRGTVRRLLLGYLPPNPRWVWKSMKKRLEGPLLGKLPAVWMVFYIHSILWSTGCLLSLREDARRRKTVPPARDATQRS